MKSAGLSRADSICIRWIFRSLEASLSPHCLFTALILFTTSFVALLFVHQSVTFLPVCLSVYCPLVYSWMSLCLGLWAHFWQGLLWLSLPRVSNRLCHIMQALLSWLWLRLVIQNWCAEELELTSCQRWMFSTGRQPSANDNVGYASRALTTPVTLWHADGDISLSVYYCL